MPRFVEDALAEVAITLVVPGLPDTPWTEWSTAALEQLVLREQARRGHPDPLTGALQALALLQASSSSRRSWNASPPRSRNPGARDPARRPRL